jgi:acid phosphatase family membrane protein YuiD
MYDASGVRLHAGRAAAVLNHFLGALPEDHQLAGLSLRDKLGHEPEEVLAGAAVGVAVGWLFAAALGGGRGGGGGGDGGGRMLLL